MSLREPDEADSDLRSLAQATEAAALFLDAECRLRLYTPRAAEMFDLGPDDLGRGLWDIQAAATDPHMFSDLGHALDGAEPEERQIVWRDGRMLLRRCAAYRNGWGRRAGLVVNYLDVSLGHHARLALDDSEARFELILMTVPNSILVIAGDGAVILANEHAESMFGYPEGGMQGVPVERLLPGAGWGDFLADPARPGAAARFALRALRQEGGEFWAEVTLGPLEAFGAAYAVAVVADPRASRPRRRSGPRWRPRCGWPRPRASSWPT